MNEESHLSPPVRLGLPGVDPQERPHRASAPSPGVRQPPADLTMRPRWDVPWQVAALGLASATGMLCLLSLLPEPWDIGGIAFGALGVAMFTVLLAGALRRR